MTDAEVAKDTIQEVLMDTSIYYHIAKVGEQVKEPVKRGDTIIAKRDIYMYAKGANGKPLAEAGKMATVLQEDYTKKLQMHVLSTTEDGKKGMNTADAVEESFSKLMLRI